MAATALAPTQISRNGGAAPAATAVDVANGNTIQNPAGYGLVLIVTNPGAAAATITFVTPGQVSGLDVADEAVSIPAGATRVFGDFPTQVFGSSLNITASAALNVTAYLTPATS